MRRSKKLSETIGQILLWVFLIAALLIFSVPFIFMITNSFEEFSYVLPYPPKLLPDRLDFSAYAHILGMDIFPTAVKNSVINTCLTVAASVLISTLSAYGFARIDFPGREAIFKLYLFTLMMPSFLNIIPQFLVLRGIELPWLKNGLNGQYATRWEWVFAASILALIPVIVLFIVFQKKMVVGGLTQGSVKG